MYEFNWALKLIYLNQQELLITYGYVEFYYMLKERYPKAPKEDQPVSSAKRTPVFLKVVRVCTVVLALANWGMLYYPIVFITEQQDATNI